MQFTWGRFIFKCFGANFRRIVKWTCKRVLSYGSIKLIPEKEFFRTLYFFPQQYKSSFSSFNFYHRAFGIYNNQIIASATLPTTCRQTKAYFFSPIIPSLLVQMGTRQWVAPMLNLMLIPFAWSVSLWQESYPPPKKPPQDERLRVRQVLWGALTRLKVQRLGNDFIFHGDVTLERMSELFVVGWKTSPSQNQEEKRAAPSPSRVWVVVRREKEVTCVSWRTP